MSEQDKPVLRIPDAEPTREEAPGNDIKDSDIDAMFNMAKRGKVKPDNTRRNTFFLVIFFGAIVFAVIGPYRGIVDNLADLIVAVVCLIFFAQILKALLTQWLKR